VFFQILQKKSSDFIEQFGKCWIKDSISQ
jgi:hypothetical protein